MIELDTDGSAMLRFAGEIDVATAGRIPQQVTNALGPSIPGVVLDLAGVTFIDSTGIGALIAARNACVAAARTFRLARPSSPVQRMLEMTGLDDVFEVLPT